MYTALVLHSVYTQNHYIANVCHLLRYKLINTVPLLTGVYISCKVRFWCNLTNITFTARVFLDKMPSRLLYTFLSYSYPAYSQLIHQWANSSTKIQFMTLGLYVRASRRLLMNETNICTVNFQFFINGTVALLVSGSFSAHHQERYQRYDGFGTILCSSVTDCCQEQDGTGSLPVMFLTAVGHRAA